MFTLPYLQNFVGLIVLPVKFFLVIFVTFGTYTHAPRRKMGKLALFFVTERLYLPRQWTKKLAV